MNSTNVRNWTPEEFTIHQESCMQLLEKSNVQNEIPLLNNALLHDFKDKQLIRFRGMIQDMYDPEYYFKKYKVKNIQTGITDIKIGMYKDAASCSTQEEILLESEDNVSSERQTYKVISIPGLNDWARETNINLNDVQSDLNFNKRQLDESDSNTMDCSEPVRKKLNTNDTNTQMPEFKTTQGMLSEEHMLNFPIPIPSGKSCIVKVYEEAPIVKLNEVCEIIGFLSVNPLLSNICEAEDAFDSAEINSHNPPVSLIPRIHAVKIIKPIKPYIEDLSLITPKLQSVRSDLHLILSQLLFGDRLAADYLICHLLSTVYARKDFLCLGNFPINITNFPLKDFKTFPKEFYNFLTLLVEKSHFLQITLENLNELQLIPMKDYECNRLTSGLLQLSNNTHLIIDETELSSGHVSTHGRKNYDTISELIKFQKVKYDFKYYTMEYDTDIPILILSEVKSFFPCLVQIVVHPDLESIKTYPQIVEAANQYLKCDYRLNDIRQYLHTLCHMEFKIEEEITNIIQEDFVQMRQMDKTITADNLHSLIVFTRLMALSHGENTICVERWKKTVEMEMTRISRLPRQSK